MLARGRPASNPLITDVGVAPGCSDRACAEVQVSWSMVKIFGGWVLAPMALMYMMAAGTRTIASVVKRGAYPANALSLTHPHLGYADILCQNVIFTKSSSMVHNCKPPPRRPFPESRSSPFPNSCSSLPCEPTHCMSHLPVLRRAPLCVPTHWPAASKGCARPA